MSLHSFLTRLIWLCVSPLLLLAAFLALDSVLRVHSARDLEASYLAQNTVQAIDWDLRARINALNMLAVSPLLDDRVRGRELYQQAQGFQASFGSHVILADAQLAMLFNTRVPFGTLLPKLPRPSGQAAAPLALASGKPAVGDLVFSPLAKQTLVAIAVPVRRASHTYLLLTLLETRQFQQRLEQVALPAGWSLALVDGQQQLIARSAGSDPQAPVGVRFVAASEVSPWSVVIEIPRAAYRAPMFAAAGALLVAILAATLAGVLGGQLASRRLGRAVAALVTPPAGGGAVPAGEASTASSQITEITEIVAVREQFAAAARQRESAENALRESERQLRATFEQAAMGIALVSPDGRWLRVNEKLCAIVGYARDELLQKTFQEITHADDLATDLAYQRQLLAREIDNYAMEKRYLRKDGAAVWINLTVALVAHADGSPDYFIAVIEDIGQRKAVEAALQAREATLREAQRLAGIGNWSWEIESDRHLWSEEIYRIYGRDPALPPAVYPEVQSYFTAASWQRLAAAVESALQTGSPYECEAEVVRGDGSQRWITARGEATRGADGSVVELHGTVQDITERRQALENLAALNENLEQRVELRTAELSAANRELDAFAYAVSHDLRAPLRALNGFAQALLEDYGERFDGDAKRYLDQIGLASRKMGQLIDGVLALSRSTRGELQRDRVDVSALANAILAELAAADPDRQVLSTIEPGLYVNADARMFEVALRNLLGNAWKYTGKTAAAAIRVYSGTGEGRICVADNGAGFEMSHAEQLFQPFRRLHRQDEFPGLGIGLATVQRIVRRHGGEIDALGVPGAGATFCFTLQGRG